MTSKKVIGWVAFALLLALYVYMVVAAVGNLLLLPEMGAALGLTVNLVGWFWLWLGIVVPIAAFAAALLITRGRGGGQKLLVLASGLAVAAAVQLEVGLLVPPLAFFA